MLPLATAFSIRTQNFAAFRKTFLKNSSFEEFTQNSQRPIRNTGMLVFLQEATTGNVIFCSVLFCSVTTWGVARVGGWRGGGVGVLLTVHLQHMRLVEVLVSVGVAAVVPHVDGGHLGDVQGAVIAKVLQYKEEEKEEMRENVWVEETGGG